MKKVDVIIPVFKPTADLLKLLDCLYTQTYKVNQIILINTEKKYLEALIAETALQARYSGILLRHLAQAEFDHGGSRNLGVSFSHSDCFLMMTQDAMPADNFLVERLMEALADEKTAVAYARQLSTSEYGELEQFSRSFNYGSQPLYKTRQDKPILGIKTYFCSNVCALYDRKWFDALGGFIEHTIFNEDMIYASKAINAGFAIQYVPAAKVFHSHRYTNKQQFQRNFDLGVSHAEHPEVFAGLSSESEGIRMLRLAAGGFLRQGKPWLVVSLTVQSGCKYLGYFLGKRYRKLPQKWVRVCSMNKNYWN